MKLQNISKIYHNKNNDVVALNNINLSFSSQGMTFIVGESGCGKTTLLNIIAGYDKDYEGTLEIEGKVECIGQEIMLMENMSVFDNLLLVSDDREKINTLLEHFQLKEKDKKVKKLSVGEKKRVQIIRSLLTKASYLICDEPTAALDHENGKSVMEMLKEISKEIGVIVVTHNLALVETYGDRVIRMGKGCIIKDEPHTSQESHIQEINQKPTFKKQMKLLIKIIQSRWQETIFRFGLLFFTLLVVFVLVCLYPALNGSMEAKSNWMNGKNVIVSEIVNPTITYREDDLKWLEENFNYEYDKYEKMDQSYKYYDVYRQEDVYLAHESIPGIIGYNMGWDWYVYDIYPPSGSFLPRVNINGLREAVEKYRQEYEETGISPYVDYEASLATLDEYDTKYPNDSFPKDQYIFIDYSNLRGYTHLNYIGSLPMTEYLYMAYKPIQAYQLFPDVELDLMMGKMPTQFNEIVVTKSLAEVLIKDYGLSSEEELIGHEVSLMFTAKMGEHSGGQNPYPLIVSGITYMDSKLENQIFFMDGGFWQPFIEAYGCQPDIATFQYLDFLTDPRMDSEEIAKSLNIFLDSKESRFEVFGNTEIAMEEYQDPMNMGMLAVFAFIVLIFLYLIMQFLLNKRIIKENRIMQRYQYNPKLIQMMMIILLIGIVVIMQLMCLSSVCDLLNGIANSLGFANIVEYSITNYMKSSLLAGLGVMILEGGIYAIRTKKSS